jgi:hypothetical protein
MGKRTIIGSASGRTPLAPGDSSTSFLTLNELFDLTKPGKYAVVVSYEFFDEKNQRVFVPSNKLTITVTE